VTTATGCDEFHFKRGAIWIRMDDRSHVASDKMMLWQVVGKGNGV